MKYTQTNMQETYTGAKNRNGRKKEEIEQSQLN